MKSILKLFAGAVVALAMSAGVASADVKFGVAAEPYPPFAEKGADGKWKGWEIEIADAICAAMNEKCEWVEVAWGRYHPGASGQEVRRHHLVHVDHRRAHEDNRLLRQVLQHASCAGCPQGHRILTVHAESSVKGKIVGAQVSTIHANYAEKVSTRHRSLTTSR